MYDGTFVLMSTEYRTQGVVTPCTHLILIALQEVCDSLEPLNAESIGPLKEALVQPVGGRQCHGVHLNPQRNLGLNKLEIKVLTRSEQGGNFPIPRHCHSIWTPLY